MTGRQSDGRFGKGNAGGPGRPGRDAEAGYLRAMSDAVPLAAWRRIVERAALDAENGDGRARDWLGRYLLATGAADGNRSPPAVCIYIPKNGREADSADD